MADDTFVGEFELTGIKEAVADLRRLEGQTDEVGTSAKAAGDGWGSFSQRITAGVVSVRAAWDAVSGLLDTLKEAGEEFERQAGIINRFSGNIDNASARVGGLISDIDLMVQSNKAAAAGLDLTGEQFGTLAVKAAEWSQATGQDATEAFNRLMQAVSTGEEGPLKELGVNLQGITDVAERKRVALEELTDGMGDMTTGADTLAGRLDTLGTEIDNVQTEMIGAVEDSGLLEQAFGNLEGATTSLIGEFSLFGDTSAGPLSDVEVFTITGAAMLTAFTERVEASITILQKLGTAAVALRESRFGDIGDALDGVQEDIRTAGGFDADQRIQELTGQGMREAAERRGAREGAAAGRAYSASTAGRGGGSRTRPELGPGPGESISAYQLQNDVLEVQREIQDELIRNQQEKNDAATESLRLAKEIAAAEAEANEQWQERKDKEMKAWQAELEQQEEQNALEEESIRLKHRAGMAQNAVNQAGALFVDSIQTAVEGQEDLGSAMLHMLDEWTKQFAIQEAYKGVAALAEAVGNAVMNQPHAGAKLSEAAMHFALAAALGGASAAIPNQGGGGGGGGASNQAPPPAAGGGGGGTTVVNFNAPVAETQLGRQYSRAQRAARRRYE